MQPEALVMHYGSAAMVVAGMVGGPILVALGGLLTHQHLMAPWHSLIGAWSGSVVANQVLYFVGRIFRDRPGLQRLFQRPKALCMLDQVARHPVGFMLGYRFVMGLRSLSPLVLGMTGRIGALRFAGLNLLAAGVWAGAFTALGYFSGTTMSLLLGRAKSIDRDLFILAAVLAVFLLARAWLKTRRGAGGVGV